MSKSNKKRYAIVMVISVVFNTFFYLIAHFYHLPVWLDMQGTAFAALVLEPAAGLLVGLVNNFIEAIFFYDASSIIYFGVSATVALIVGIYLSNHGKIRYKRILPAIFFVIMATSAMSTLLTFWRNGGIPTSTWEQLFYQMALDHGFPQLIATFFGIMVLKVGDILCLSVLTAGLYVLLPKKLKYDLEPKEVKDIDNDIEIG